MGFAIPEHLVSNFHLRPGDRVGDFGAGSGQVTKVLSRAVGSEGRVFAFEIQKQLAEHLASMARTEHLSNVEVLWGDLEAPHGVKLADASLDAALLINTLFQLEDRDAALSEIARVLKRGGSLFIVDWTDSFGGMGPEPAAIVPEGAAEAIALRHGFKKERTYPAGEHHYGIAFRKV